MTRHIPELPGSSVKPTSATPRFVVVEGDNMEPTLSRGDLVGVLPINAYRAEGLYLLNYLSGMHVLRCHRNLSVGGIDLIRDNKRYTTTTVPEEWFQGVVLAKVFAICQVTDRSLLQAAGLNTGWDRDLPRLNGSA